MEITGLWCLRGTDLDAGSTSPMKWELRQKSESVNGGDDETFTDQARHCMSNTWNTGQSPLKNIYSLLQIKATSLLEFGNSKHDEPRRLVWGPAEQSRTRKPRQPLFGEEESS